MPPHDNWELPAELSEHEKKFVASRRKWWPLIDRANLSKTARAHLPSGTQSSSTGSTTTSRRRWLQAMGLGGAAMLAGCAEDDPDDPDPANGEPSPEAPVYSTVTTTVDPSRVDYNAYHLDHALGEGLWSFMSHLFAHRSSGHMTLVPDLVDWEVVEPTEYHVTIRDEMQGLTWFNGEEVTAEDLRAKFVLERLDDQRPHEHDDHYEIIDDYTLAIHLAEAVNPDAYFNTIATTQFNTRYSLYEEWVEWAVESDYDVEVLEDLHEFNIDEPTGNGPWIVVDRTADKFFLELREEHPNADLYNWDECEYVFTPQADVQWQRVITDNTSAEMGRIPEAIVDQVPDHFDWYHAPTRFGMSVMFNYDVFPEWRARKAMAYALDGEIIALNSGLPLEMAIVLVGGIAGAGGEEAMSHQSGVYLNEEGHRDLLGDDLVDSFEQYHPQDTEKAIELWEEEGYEHDGDTLYYPDGEEVTFEIQAPTFLPTFIPRAETVVDQLADIGVEGSLSVKEPGAYFTDHARGDYGASTYYTGGGTWDPGQNLTWHFTPARIDRPVEQGVDLENFEMPMPIGDRDGTTESVDLLEHVLNLEHPDEEVRRDAFRHLTWAQNQCLHHYILTDGIDTQLLNGANWDGPAEDDPISGQMSPPGWTRRPESLQARLND